MNEKILGYLNLLHDLDEGHKEEQKFNRETFGEAEFDPFEDTLLSEAATAIRSLLREAGYDY